MNRKAQGLSLNMVIVAAIALIILVIIVAVFTGRIGVFGRGISACSTKQGTCKPECLSEETQLLDGKCPEEGQGDTFTKCCIAVQK